MVNWIQKPKPLSDEEVIHEGNRYIISLPSAGMKGRYYCNKTWDIFGDTAICIHPKMNAFTMLLWKNADIPIVGREIIILDD